MPWLKRGTNSYFYESKTVRGNEVSNYLGRGPAAQASSDAIETRKAQRAKLAFLRQRDQNLDLQFDLLSQMVHNEVAAVLEPKGYHRYRTQWVIVGKGLKKPVHTSGDPTPALATEPISSLATSLCDQVLDRLADEPQMAAKLRQELDQLRSDLTTDAGNLEKLLIEQVLVAHAINMVAMWDESQVSAEELYAAERYYWTHRVNRTTLRLCRSVAGLMGLRKLKE